MNSIKIFTVIINYFNLTLTSLESKSRTIKVQPYLRSTTCNLNYMIM